MNITALFSLYYSIAQSQYVASDINIETSHSLRYVIDNYFMKYSSSFVYILSCPSKGTLNFFRDLMGILFSYWDTMKVQIVMNDMDAGPIGPGERNFNLILVDGGQSFVNLDPASKVQNYDINEYYYVFVQNRDPFLPKDIQTVFDYCWQHYIINVNILVQKASGELIIYTYFPFTSTHCGKVIPVEINRYRNGTMDNKDLFPEKLLNMHQCPLKVALWNIPPFIVLDEQKTGRGAIGGFEGELLKTLSDFMNFRIDYVVPPNNEGKGTFSENGSTGAKRMLQVKDADLSLGFFRFTIDSARKLTPSVTYYQSKQIMFVLQESPNYLSPELIFYPFSPTIWLLLITTFILVMGIIWGTIFWARRISFGISCITLNNICIDFIAITLGMTAILCPRTNFGRLFMTTWMLSTLIIRAQYQALIFHLIRNNFFKLPPNSIEQLVQQRYTLVMNHFNYDAMSTVPFFQETSLDIQEISSEYHESIYSYLEDHQDRKLAGVTPSDFLLYYGAKNRKAGVFVALPETILVHSTCIHLTKHSFLVNRINSLVRWMSAFGLITSWVSKALDLSYFMVPPETKQTTIGHDALKGAYYLCGILMVFSTIVFFLELLSVKCRILASALEKL